MKLLPLAAVYCVLPVAGGVVSSLWAFRRLNVLAQLAVLTSTGAVFYCAEFFLLSVVRIPWTLGWLALPVFVGAVAFVRYQAPERNQSREQLLSTFVGFTFAALALGVLGYALATARVTSMDYLCFWGTKGFRFAAAKTIDFEFLRDPAHDFLHPDYPPLVSLVYALVTSLSGSPSWWVGLVGTWVFALGSVVAIAGSARLRLAGGMAAAVAGLWAAFLAFGLMLMSSGGNGEAFLLFFESLGLGLLLFATPGRTIDVFAGSALAGATLTKVEGGAFTAVLLVVMTAFSRRGDRQRVIRIALLPLVALGVWITITRVEHIAWAYGPHPFGAFTTRYLAEGLRAFLASASYQLFYVPWIAAIGLWLFAPRPRRGLPSALIGVGTALVSFFYFLHGSGSPVEWISGVAPRLLMASVLCFVCAAAVANADSPAERCSALDFR
jgi:hypothetical protein